MAKAIWTFSRNGTGAGREMTKKFSHPRFIHEARGCASGVPITEVLDDPDIVRGISPGISRRRQLLAKAADGAVERSFPYFSADSFVHGILPVFEIARGYPFIMLSKERTFAADTEGNQGVERRLRGLLTIAPDLPLNISICQRSL
jgi:hypothetical protein